MLAHPFSSTQHSTVPTGMLAAHQSVLVVDTPQLVNGIPIKMAAKRYVPSLLSNKQGLTLLFAHGGAARKSSL